MKLSREKVDKVLAEKGWNYQELERQSGVAYQTFYHGLKGRETKAKTVGKLARALEVDVQDIVKETGVSAGELETIAHTVCEEYCKYRTMFAISKSVLDNICAACPLNTLVKGGR